jgi:hypothetical protein
MLELMSYTDAELIEVFEIAPITLKSKRKITEQRLLKDYEWSRDKKKKLYTIHGYKEQAVEDSLLSTFESMISEFTPNKVPLKNLEKSLRILVTMYYIDESLPKNLALYANEKPQEISRYAKKFRELDILVKEEYDYYLIDEEDLIWEQIDKAQYDNIASFWSEQFYKAIDKFRVPAINPNMEKVILCREIATYKTIENYGFTRKVTKKDLTDEAKDYFGPFLRYSNKELRMMFEETVPTIE